MTHPESHHTANSGDGKAHDRRNAASAVHSRLTLITNELGGTLPPMSDKSIVVICSMPDTMRSLRIALWTLLESLNAEEEIPC